MLGVNRPHSKVKRPNGCTPNADVGRATDVTRVVSRPGTIAPGARVHVARDGVAAHVKPVIMVDVIDVAEESVGLTSSHDPEVRFVARLRQTAIVGGRPRRDKDESSAGGEVARDRNDVGFYDGYVRERQHGHEEPSRQECGYQLSYSCYFAHLFFLHSCQGHF